MHNYYIEKNNKLNEHNRLQQHPVSSSSDVMSPDHRTVNDRKPFLLPSVRRSSCGNGCTAVVPSSQVQSQHKRAAAAEGAAIPGVNGAAEDGNDDDDDIDDDDDDDEEDDEEEEEEDDAGILRFSSDTYDHL